MEARSEATEMPINIEAIIEGAFEEAFARALNQAIQSKAEALFLRALDKDSPLGKKLEEKIEQGFQKFVDEGIQWEKKRPGFKK